MDFAARLFSYCTPFGGSHPFSVTAEPAGLLVPLPKGGERERPFSLHRRPRRVLIRLKATADNRTV